MVEVTLFGLYDEYLSTDSLMEVVVGVYEINHIVQFKENSYGRKYELLMDKETEDILSFLCNSWASKIRATVFKSAIEEWMNTQEIPYHIIPKSEWKKWQKN